MFKDEMTGPAVPRVSADDAALAMASKTGDSAAFEELVARYDRKLFRIALTADKLKASAFAVSCNGCPSMSCITKTARSPGRRSINSLVSKSRNSDALYCSSGFGLQSDKSIGSSPSSSP
jgi:hypothetical protein